MVRPGYFAKMVNHIWLDIPREVEHCLRLYMWFVDATTGEEKGDDGKIYGIVNYGNPVRLKNIGLDLKRSWSAFQKQVDLLVEYGYLSREQTNKYSAYTYKVTQSFKFNKTEEKLRVGEDEGFSARPEVISGKTVRTDVPVPQCGATAVPSATGAKPLTNNEMDALTSQSTSLIRKFEKEIISPRPFTPQEYNIGMLRIREYLMDAPVKKQKGFPANHRKVSADFISRQMDAIVSDGRVMEVFTSDDEVGYFLDHLFDTEEPESGAFNASTPESEEPGYSELKVQAASLANDFNQMFMSGKGNKSDLYSWSMFIREYLDGTAEALEEGGISPSTIQQIMRKALSNNWKSRISTAASPMEYFIERIYGTENGECLAEGVEDEVDNFEYEPCSDEPDGETFDLDEA